MDVRLRVLQSTPEPRPTTNPYIVMLQGALKRHSDVDLLTFQWRTALRARYDVFHVHWPEILVGGKSSFKKLIRQALTVALLTRLRFHRTPIVRTVHNVQLPTGISRIERLLLHAFDRQTSFRILLNSETALPEGQPSTTIAHGHYRDWFAEIDRFPIIPGRLGFVGMVRRYKGVEKLISSFGEARRTEPTLSLRIGGTVTSTALEQELNERAANDERIQLDFHFLTDSELVEIVTSSELVVLPYQFMHNSGGVLAALSLDRPVLVPDNAVNRALAAEVGIGWVWLYEGEIDSDVLIDTMSRLRARRPTVRPDLGRRGWDEAGNTYVEAYRRAIRISTASNSRSDASL